VLAANLPDERTSERSTTTDLERAYVYRERDDVL
jgi:hypothetical protein